MKNKKLQKVLDAILIPVLAILSGLVLMGIMIALTGKPVWESYGVLFSKAFGCEKASNCAIVTTLERATPIILTGLSAVVAFRSGLFSIGQEGQYLMASIAAAWLGYSIHLPNGVHQSVILVVCMAVGAAYGFIPGVLKVKLGVNELLSTIVLNSIATLIIEYMVQFPLRADVSTTAHSPIIDETAQLPIFMPVPNGVWASSSRLWLSSSSLSIYGKRNPATNSVWRASPNVSPYTAVFPAIKPPSAP